ncbi:MAG: lipase maturation factor family protein, partial [Glaciihabitans sp.]|nr:lipase maturation factor family protein [Glaciihabitans sp.]
GWFPALLARIMDGDPAIRRLIRVDPFDGRPPRLLRVRMFRYRFATRAERRASGLYWIREPAYVLVPPTRRS